MGYRYSLPKLSDPLSPKLRKRRENRLHKIVHMHTMVYVCMHIDTHTFLMFYTEIINIFKGGGHLD